jgi:hypothetical protein
MTIGKYKLEDLTKALIIARLNFDLMPEWKRLLWQRFTQRR